MAEPNRELGRAVKDALSWLGATPETAGPLLGINARTLDAMCQGIVPMRSLVIRFATSLSRHCERGEGAGDWWGDVDAWLRLAGYSPRRDGDAAQNGSEPRPAAHSAGPHPPDPGGAAPSARPAFQPVRAPSAVPSPSDAGPGPSTPDDLPAREYYRPVYERKAIGDSFVHVFRIVDPDDRNAFERPMSPSVDYRAEAAKVKQDLASLSKAQFERKYWRFRVTG